MITSGPLGCGGESPSTPEVTVQPSVDQPSPSPANAAPSPFELAQSWSHEQAVAALDDSESCLLAAMRIVATSDASPLWGTALTEAAPPLGVVWLDDAVLALGWRIDDNTLGAPLLILRDGTVTHAATGAEEEVARLMIGNADIGFPHVLASPWRLKRWVDGKFKESLLVDSLGGARWRVVREPPMHVEAALRAVDGSAVPVASYQWDRWEGAFSGPAYILFPEPFRGSLRLDLDRSPELIPVGGILASPPEENAPDPADDWDLPQT